MVSLPPPPPQAARKRASKTAEKINNNPLCFILFSFLDWLIGVIELIGLNKNQLNQLNQQINNNKPN
jgi:hypothetical protein